MADHSSIEWTQATWNPTTGCDRVSPGCDHCYALTLAKRLKAMGNPKYQADGDARTSGPGFGLTVHSSALNLPRQWRHPRTIFVNSMSDLFHPNVPTEFIDDVFAVMADTPRHTFQLLTKRSKRMVDLADRLTWPLNLWVGVSIESDPYSYRANHLRRVPSAVRFVSAEPLLGPLPSLNLTQVDWLIAGGESGHHSRPMHPEWARDLRDRCRDANVAFFFKQWGSWAPAYGPTAVTVAIDGRTRVNSDPELADTAVRMHRVSRATAGRVLDGDTWDQLPEPWSHMVVTRADGGAGRERSTVGTVERLED